MLDIGETAFLPLELRKGFFEAFSTQSHGETETYQLFGNASVKVLGVEIDPRYGKVALVSALSSATS